MKQLVAITLALFAFSTMAADAPTVTTSATATTAPAAPHKTEIKPIKSQTKVQVKEAKAK